MLRFVVRRLLLLVPILSGSRCSSSAGSGRYRAARRRRCWASGRRRETIRQIRRDYGLDKPVYIQYGATWSRVVRSSTSAPAITHAGAPSPQRAPAALPGHDRAHHRRRSSSRSCSGSRSASSRPSATGTWLDHGEPPGVADRRLDPGLLPRDPAQVRLRGRSSGFLTDGRADLHVLHRPRPPHQLLHARCA